MCPRERFSVPSEDGRLLALQDSLVARAGLDIPQVVAEELQIDVEGLDGLQQLWNEPSPAVTPERITAVLHLPDAMARLARGADPALEPGAITYEPRGLGGTVVDSIALSSKYGRGSVLDRFLQWWIERPVLSMVYGVLMIIAAAVRAVWAAIAGWTPLAIAFTIAGALIGAGMVALSVAVRRANRADQSAPD